MRTRLDSPDHLADGVLSPEILAHLEGCPDCRRFRDRLASILDPRSALPRDIQPTRDLWPAIASRLENERRIRRAYNYLALAAAAVIAAVVVASQFSLPSRQDSNVAAVPAPETAPAPLPAATVEVGFVRTRAVLVKMVEAQKETMAPEQVAVLEHTLATIDSAVQDLHAALEVDPYNPSLLFKLSYTRRRELRFLQQAIL